MTRASLLGRVTARFRMPGGGDSLVLIGTTMASNLVRIASTMIMTRLLAPDIFGLVGIIIAVFFIVTMITDLGFQGYVVRHPEGDDPRFLHVIWTIHALRGVGLAILSAALAMPLSQLFAKPDLALPLAVASITFLINGLASLSLITALRTRQIQKLCYLDLGLLVFQTGIALIAAAMLHNVWSIIVGMVAAAILRSILSYVLFDESGSRLAFDRGISEDFWRFSRFVMGSSFLTLLITQADKVVLARILNLNDFGLYVVATTLAGVPIGFAGTYANRILYPLYTKVFRENPDGIAEIYYSGRRSMSLLYGFFTAGLIGCSPLVIEVLYDNRYAGSSTYLSWLVVASVMTLGNRAANEAMTALGHVQVTLIGNIYRVGWLISAGVVAFHFFGAPGLVAVVGLVELPPKIYNWWLLRRFDILDPREEATLAVGAIAGATTGFLATSFVSLIR